MNYVQKNTMTCDHHEINFYLIQILLSISDFQKSFIKAVSCSENHQYVWIMIWAATWQNHQSECAPSEDSDQPGHPPSLIRVFACGCPGWSESSLGAHSFCCFFYVVAHVLSYLIANLEAFQLTSATGSPHRLTMWAYSIGRPSVVVHTLQTSTQKQLELLWKRKCVEMARVDIVK